MGTRHQLLRLLDQEGNVVEESMGIATHTRLLMDRDVKREFVAERIEYRPGEVDAQGDPVVAFIVYREVKASHA